MSACWMFMILLGCRLSHASESQSTYTCNYQLKTHCVSASDNVSVPCPQLTAEDRTFILYKNEKVIYENQASKHESNTSVGVTLHEQNGSVSFILTEVNADRHGLYRCEGTVKFPPPYKKITSALGILVLVEGHQCKYSRPSPETGQEVLILDVHQGIWISVTVVLCIYSIVITTIAVVNWIKMRRSDSQNDYMNTKPRAPKDRKRGFLKPLPQYL